MEMKLDPVSLEALGGGAVGELFNRELKAVLDNMADLNAECKVKREITIKVSFVPTEQRDACAVEMKVASKLASVKPAITQLLLGQEGAKQVAYEQRLVQPALFGDGDSVVPIGRQGGK